MIVFYQSIEEVTVAICRPIPKPSSRFFLSYSKKGNKYEIDQVFLPHPIPQQQAYMLDFHGGRLSQPK